MGRPLVCHMRRLGPGPTAGELYGGPQVFSCLVLVYKSPDTYHLFSSPLYLIHLRCTCLSILPGTFHRSTHFFYYIFYSICIGIDLNRVVWWVGWPKSQSGICLVRVGPALAQSKPKIGLTLSPIRVTLSSHFRNRARSKSYIYIFKKLIYVYTTSTNINDYTVSIRIHCSILILNITESCVNIVFSRVFFLFF